MRLWRWEFMMIGIGIALRFIWAKLIPNIPVSDFKYYYDMAVNLAGPPKDWVLGYVGPGSSFVLSLFFRLFESTDLWIAKAVNVGISSLSLILFHLLCTRLFKRRSDHRMALLLFALLPNYIAYNSTVGTEIFTLFLMLLLVLLQTVEYPRMWHVIPLGILAGIASLTKPYFMAFPVIAFAVFWLRSYDPNGKLIVRFLRSGVHAVLVGIIMFATISPMTIYNYNEWKMIIPVSFNGGYNLYLNNNDANHIGRYISIEQIPTSATFQAKLDELGIKYGAIDPRAEKIYRDEAIHWIANHPFQFLGLGGLRILNTFFAGGNDISNWTYQTNDPQFKELMSHTWFIALKLVAGLLVDIMLFFIVIFTIVGGIWLLVRKIRSKRDPEQAIIEPNTETQSLVTARQQLLPNIDRMLYIVVWVYIGFFSSLFFVFEGQPRYNYPTLFLFILGTVATFRLLRERDRRKRVKGSKP